MLHINDASLGSGGSCSRPVALGVYDVGGVEASDLVEASDCVESSDSSARVEVSERFELSGSKSN